MAFQTALGLGRRGFFTPYRYAAGAKPIEGYPEIEGFLDRYRPEFTEILAKIEAFEVDLVALGHKPPPAPRWNQGWFAPLDAAVAYTLVRTEPPKRIIEVGSGHSTRFLAQAVKQSGQDVDHVCIDPRTACRFT